VGRRDEAAVGRNAHANNLTPADVEYLAPIAEMDAEEALAQAVEEFRSFLRRSNAVPASIEFRQECNEKLNAVTSFAEFCALKTHYYEEMEASIECASAEAVNGRLQ
jgi:hypothetical protein